MLAYLLLGAIAITAPEQSTIEVVAIESPVIQEVVTLLNHDENPSIITAKTPQTIMMVKAEPITITNVIEPSMLEYKHWTGKYSPEQFTISINGTEVEVGKNCQIPGGTKTIEIGYSYSFMNGMKTGGRKISYELNEKISQANITFDWKDDWRVIIDNGKAVKEISS